MKLVITEVGDGITRRTKKRIVFDASDPRRKRKREIFAAVEQVIGEARQEWGPQQLVIQAIRKEAAELREQDTKRLDCDPSYLSSDEYKSRYLERSTLAWYVIEMDADATMAELAMAEGRPWEAVSWAMKLAEALAEARLRHDWNRAAKVGKKQLGHAEDGRALRRQQSAEVRNARVLELKNAGCSLRAAFEKAAKEFGVSYSTMSRDYYKNPRS